MEEKIITPSVPTIEYVVVDGAKYEILTDKDREALKRLDKNAVEEVMVAGGTAMRNGHTVQITGLQTKLKPGQGIDVDEEGNIVCTLDSQLYEIHTETKPTGVPEHVNRIHLFPMEVSIEGGSNRFAEYIYLTDEKRWEKLGEIDTKIKVTLDINSLADLDKFNTDKDSGCYVVRLKRGKDFFSIGTIDIFADSMRHVVYQVINTSEQIDASGVLTGSHSDGVLHSWKRVYNISSPSLPIETKGKWGNWENVEDKTYQPEKFSGMGRVVLPLNLTLVDDGQGHQVTKNVLTKEMVSQANTIYVVKHAFDLNNTGIELKNGCEIVFDGGKISNGVITFDNTYLSGVPSFSDVIPKGKIKNDVVEMAWFEGKAQTDVSPIANSLLESNTCISFGGGTHHTEHTITVFDGKRIEIAESCQIVKDTKNKDLEPAVWMYGRNSVIKGHNCSSSLIKSNDDSPLGVVRLGFKDMNDVAMKNVLYNQITDIAIAGNKRGGNPIGKRNVCLSMINPFTDVNAASYFHIVTNIRFHDANIGIHMLGDANANQFSNLHFDNVDNEHQQNGGAIVLEEMTYEGKKRFPLDNNFNNIFHHYSPNAVTLNIIGTCRYNNFNGLTAEQSGERALWIKASDTDNVSGNVFIGVSNTFGGGFTQALKDRNTVLDKTVLHTNMIGCRELKTSSIDVERQTAKGMQKNGVTIKGLRENCMYRLMDVTLNTSLQSNTYYIKLRTLQQINAQNLGKYMLKNSIIELLIYRGRDNQLDVRVIRCDGDAFIYPIIEGTKLSFLTRAKNNGTNTTALSCTYVYEVRGSLRGDSYDDSIETFSIKEYQQPEEYVGDVKEIPQGYHDVPVVSSASKLPTLTAKQAGYKMFVNDVKKEFTWNGAEWTEQATKGELPTKVSQLENDAHYLTTHQDISGKLDKGVYDKEKNTFATKVELGGKADKIITEASAGGASVSKTLLPNVFYNLGECGAMNIMLAAGEDGEYNEYMFSFKAKSAVLTLPASVRWLNDEAPTLLDGVSYEVSIVNNLAVIGG